jgi:hypothetical protein
MAVEGFFHQNSNYDAVDVRHLFSIYNSEGILGDKTTNISGSATSTTQFTLTSGYAIVQHDAASAGKFLVYSDSSTVFTLTMPSAGTNRRWLVYLQVEDVLLDGAASDLVSFKTSSNDSAGTPSLPSTPSDSLPLYDITVTGGNTLLSGGTIITDLRTQATPPWNIPWGRVASATTSTVTGTITSSYKDLTDLTVTWTAVANRRYKVTGYVDVSSTSASIARVAITDGSNNLKAQSQLSISASDVGSHTVYEVFTGSAGSTTRKLRSQVTAGTGATQSNVYGPHLILVEDIGPA